MSLSSSISTQQHATIDHRGLYLVSRTNVKGTAPLAEGNFIYRAMAVGAALFLAMTVC